MLLNKKNNIIYLNKKIYFNYFIIKEIEAGIVLKGWEVKLIKKGLIDISNSYIINFNNELFAINFLINIKNNNFYNFNNKRKKKILLHKKQINFLIKNLKNKNKYSIVILSLYWKNNNCKLNIALVKGKKKYDKRYMLKLKEWKNKKNIYENNINYKNI